MGTHRVSRLNEQLRREISEIVRQHLRDPRIGPVTVTAVRVTPDLDLARVYVTAPDEPARPAETLAGLRAAANHIRGELGHRLRLRHIPELRFQLDESLAHARRIEQLLAQVRAAGQPAAPSEDEDGAEPKSAAADGDPA
ncbi:MAG: 30S ribosome-binding factor RbfA [Gemmatimonadetes bacterium]|nr:30S ribosome-binding factor RbfA [Gemmatimonadota bacterium]